MDLLWKERKRIWCGLPLTFTVYSYDNERFYVKSGFLNQRQDEVRLYRIQDLTVTRSLSQRIFGMGTILVNSSDKTLGDFEIKNIKNVMDIKEQLSRWLKYSETKTGIYKRKYLREFRSRS